MKLEMQTCKPDCAQEFKQFVTEAVSSPPSRLSVFQDVLTRCLLQDIYVVQSVVFQMFQRLVH